MIMNSSQKSRWLLLVILVINTLSTKANQILEDWLRENLLKKGEKFSANNHYIQLTNSVPPIYTACVSRRDPKRIENGSEWYEGSRFYRCLISPDGTKPNRPVQACRNDLTGERIEDGQIWIDYRFVLRCRIGEEFLRKEIEHIACLNDDGERVKIGTFWKSRFHGMVMQCRHERVVFTACLDKDMREIPLGRTFTRPGGFRHRCEIGKKGERDLSKVVGCSLGLRQLSFGEKATEKGFRITCKGPIQPYLRYDCQDDGHHMDSLGIVRKCFYAGGPISIEGCAPDPRDAYNFVRNGFKWRKMDENNSRRSTTQSCRFHPKKDNNLEAVRVHGGVEAIACNTETHSVWVGCYKETRFSDKIVYCRRETVWSRREAEYGILPNEGNYTQFLKNIFGLRYCGRLSRDDGPSALVSDSSSTPRFLSLPKIAFTALFAAAVCFKVL